jgi:chromosome segregation ATPase
MRAKTLSLSQNRSHDASSKSPRNSYLAALLVSAIALCSLALLSVPARAQDSSQQTGDPVADAARRSREAKRNAAKPKKVYTDDDISRRKPTPSPTDAAGAATNPNAATTPAPANAAAPADEDAKNEAAWRKSFKDQREKIARAEKELDILQRETQKAQIQYYPDPQKAMNEQYTRKDINEKDAKIEAKRQEIAQLKQGLSDLEDALRKAGGNPGWSRE